MLKGACFEPLSKAINCNNDILSFTYADWKRSYNINTDSVLDIPRFNVMIARDFLIRLVYLIFMASGGYVINVSTHTFPIVVILELQKSFWTQP